MPGTNSATSSVAQAFDARWDRAEFLKRQLAFVLAEEAQQPLVVLGLQIEKLDEQLVAAARLFQPAADDSRVDRDA